MKKKQSKKEEKLVVLKEEPKPKPKTDPFKKVLYFAYGSNMDTTRLVTRVGAVKNIGTFTLKDYKLMFNVGGPVAYANVEKSEGDCTEGVIYEMFYHQLKTLDTYECLYKREKFEFNDDERLKGRKLHVYIGKWTGDNFEYPLEMCYYRALLRGAMANGLKATEDKLRAISAKNIIRNRPVYNPFFYMMGWDN